MEAFQHHGQFSNTNVMRRKEYCNLFIKPPFTPSSMLEGALGCFVLQVAIKINFEISSLGFSFQH